MSGSLGSIIVFFYYYFQLSDYNFLFITGSINQALNHDYSMFCLSICSCLFQSSVLYVFLFVTLLGFSFAYIFVTNLWIKSLVEIRQSPCIYILLHPFKFSNTLHFGFVRTVIRECLHSYSGNDWVRMRSMVDCLRIIYGSPSDTTANKVALWWQANPRLRILT